MTQSTVIEIGTILSAIALVKRWYNALSKLVAPLVIEVEKRAQDGLIDRNDRKVIVIQAIGILEAQKQIKLNFISRYIVSKIADYIAQKLPDFKISQNAESTIDKAVGNGFLGNVGK